MTRRISTSVAHLHAKPVPVPRATGLHSPHRRAGIHLTPADYARIHRESHVDRAGVETPICNASSRGRYDGADLRPTAGVPSGRMAAFHLPSRVGDRLRFPDGRVTDLQGNPLTHHP